MTPPDGILAAALAYAARGWSVLPLCPSNHLGVGKSHRGCNSPGKRPFFPDRDTRSGEWKEFQSRRATEDELRKWWESNPFLNVGVALGPVSGLVGIDVDDDDGDDLLAELSGGDLPKTWEYKTGKGRRLLYGLPPGCEVVNHAFKRAGTEIEILRFMSRGGQVVLPPSVHPNGKVYEWRPFLSPDDIPVAPAPEWLRNPQHPEAGEAFRPADGELITEGGRNSYLTSLAGAMRKRGADEPVILAALEATNESRFDPPLDEAEVRSVARSICRYAPDDFTGVTFKQTQPNRLPVELVTGARKFKWASELTAPPKADDWIWHGYLPRSGITLLSALWKAGKTTLLAHLLRALGDGGEFLGKAIKASKILYVSEEGELHWVRRRDDLGIGDHAGFYLQPFASKPNPQDWLAFLAGLKNDIETHGFDLVVFDTLAKLWPVVEENDAGAVDAALMPLWELTKVGAGILLIHHLRKSGGGEYTASRGSGALSAFPDILVELTRFDASDPKSRKRTLKAKGRYEETPDELVIELTDGQYREVHEPLSTTGPAATFRVPDPETDEDRILSVLRNNANPWMTIKEIWERLRDQHWGIREGTVRTHLFSLYEKGIVVVSGELRSKTNPRRYAFANRPDLKPSQSAPECVNGPEIGPETEGGGQDISSPHLKPNRDPGADGDGLRSEPGETNE